MKPKVVLEKREKTRLRGKDRPSLKRLPNVDTMFGDRDDPLANVEYNPESLEQSAENEMSEVLRQLLERRKAQQDRFRVARDPEFFVVLCFQSRAQRNEFLEKSGWGVEDERYLNGLQVCRLLGIDVQPIDIKPIKPRGKFGKYSRAEVL